MSDSETCRSSNGMNLYSVFDELILTYDYITLDVRKLKTILENTGLSTPSSTKKFQMYT